MNRSDGLCFVFKVVPRRRQPLEINHDQVKSVVIIESEESRAVQRLNAMFPRCTVLEIACRDLAGAHAT
jgi:hypothetical protein